MQNENCLRLVVVVVAVDDDDVVAVVEKSDRTGLSQHGGLAEPPV